MMIAARSEAIRSTAEVCPQSPKRKEHRAALIADLGRIGNDLAPAVFGVCGVTALVLFGRRQQRELSRRVAPPQGALYAAFVRASLRTANGSGVFGSLKNGLGGFLLMGYAVGSSNRRRPSRHALCSLRVPACELHPIRLERVFRNTDPEQTSATTASS